MEVLGYAAVLLVAYAPMALSLWLGYQRRLMLHRERLAAIEKGIDLPQLQQDVKRRGWNVQRMLLLAGLVWIWLGIGAFVTLSAMIASGSEAAKGIPKGMEWVGIAPVGIGISFLVVYFVGKKREQ